MKGDPQTLRVRKLQARKLFQSQQIQAAKKLYLDIFHNNPCDAEVLYALGIIHAQLRDYTSAAACFDKVTILSPQMTEAFYYHSTVLLALDKYDEALGACRRVIALKPEFAEAHFNMGLALSAQEEFSLSAAAYERAVSIKPEYPEAWSNLGGVLIAQGKFEASLAAHIQATRLETNNPNMYTSIAATLLRLGRPSEAIENCRIALKKAPDNAVAHWNLSHAILYLNDLEQGWIEYEWRRKCGIENRDFRRPRWDGSTLKNRTILIYAEQGIGDEIMFSSCLPDLLSIAGHVVIDCSPRLAPLFKRSFPPATVHGASREEPVEWIKKFSVDFQLAIGSLPRYFRSSERTFPQRTGYLEADPELVRFWETRFNKIGKGITVGIAWCGGSNRMDRSLRTVPLAGWSEILNVAGVKFVNLQYGATRDEIGKVKNVTGIEIYDWEDIDPLIDLDKVAAQMSALDLVISVDNTSVHLGGSLGIPTWVLLHNYADWRWMGKRADSPWYASLRLFRQSNPGDFEGVLQSVAAELQILVGDLRDN